MAKINIVECEIVEKNIKEINVELAIYNLIIEKLRKEKEGENIIC